MGKFYNIDNIDNDNVKKEKNSKIQKILKYYYKKNYDNFNMEAIQARIININIYIQFIQQNGKRPEYRVYIQPVDWLPSTYIKNPASFFVFCTIHGFLTNIQSIIIKNSNIEINLTKYEKIVLINRMLHLFFVKWFDFVLYDMIKKFVKDSFIQEFFESHNIVPLSEAEILSFIKIIEDIKKSWFDINKYHFNEQLWKLSNEWAFSENIFLEVAMKYENKIREYLWYDATYIKPASYHDDTNNKTDFNWIFSLDKKLSKYRSIAIQFTVSRDTEWNKLNWIIEKFAISKEIEFIYIQADGEFKKNINKNIELYKQWILDPEKRKLQDPTKFPLFIHHTNINIKELIVIYFYFHHILRYIWAKQIPILNINIDWIDLSKIIIIHAQEYKFVYKSKKQRFNSWDNFKNNYRWKIEQISYFLYENERFLWKIIYLRKEKT